MPREEQPLIGVVAVWDDPEAQRRRLLSKLLQEAIFIMRETAAEFRQARELLENLTFADHDLSPAEVALRELLKKLVIDYDDRMHPLPKIEPRKLVKSLLEQRALKQRDLIPILGASGTVSDILSGKRSISKSQAKKLAGFFRISAEYFI